MLLLGFWSSFWKQWAEVALDGDSSTEESTPPSTSEAIPENDGLSPQEKYEYLTKFGTQILCLLSASEGCTYISKNFETITGQKRADRLGQKFFNLVHSDFRARLKELLATRTSKNKPHSLRCKLQHADKKWYWYLLQIHSKGETNEFVCIAESIHDSMLTQNTLQKAKLEAELALRARSEFLANMSHELRTPLNAVIGFSQIIESEMFGKIDNPQYIEYITHIQESGYDLLAKIEDLLEIANIDAGRVTLSRTDVHVSDILRQVVEAQTHHANSAKVTLEIAPMENDILLNVDRLKMQHILGHLVANAIRFSQVGGKVLLQAEATEKGGLLISVHDTGTGMADSKLDAIVTALQEESCWTAENSRSIGLGLALTREFVALHGGQVNVISQAGIGTTIEIALPKDCIRPATLEKADYLRQVAN